MIFPYNRTFLGSFCNKQDHRHPRNTPRLPLVELLYSDTGLLQSAGHEKCSYWLALPRRGWQALIGREQRHITLPKTGQPRKEDAPRWKAKGVQLLHLQLPTEQEEPLNCMVLTGSLLSQDTLRERVTSTEAVNIMNAPWIQRFVLFPFCQKNDKARDYMAKQMYGEAVYDTQVLVVLL